ncbi:MAG TPA: DegT/DnrJ/EryC1/StrS family aminotransferase [Thermoplasmata archaeon]|nr:DegT/DnrJ/EryC1/StrS family aminotransferase [Thermoplasmata archaeon]
MATERKVFWSVPDIGADEKKAVLETLETGWLGMGPKTKQFEKELSAYTGAKHSIVVNNGTSALTTALMTLGIGPGDEVLVPTYTFVATASSVIALGAKPILVDCEPDTFNVGPAQIEAALQGHPKAKALLFVDVAGLPCDIDAIRAVAAKHHLLLLEDAAEAFAGVYKSTRLGNFDHVTIFSFHIAKQVTTVEGGAIQTNRDDLVEKLRLVRSHGEGKEKYVHVELGLNFRPTDIQSAIGLAQLKKADHYIALRDKIAKLYMGALGRWLTFQKVPSYATRPTWMIFMVLAKTKEERDKLNQHLNAHGVDTRIPWPPINRQPYFRARFGDVPCPVADATFDRALSLPIGNAMTEDDVHYVIETVRAFYEKKG